jgi:hypothetical protein
MEATILDADEQKRIVEAAISDPSDGPARVQFLSQDNQETMRLTIVHLELLIEWELERNVRHTHETWDETAIKRNEALGFVYCPDRI